MLLRARWFVGMSSLSSEMYAGSVLSVPLVADGAGGTVLVIGCAAAACAAFRFCMELAGSGSFDSPRRTSRSSSIAVSLSIGARFGCCLITSSRWHAASRIQLAGVSWGIVIAWCLKPHNSDVLLVLLGSEDEPIVTTKNKYEDENIKDKIQKEISELQQRFV